MSSAGVVEKNFKCVLVLTSLPAGAKDKIIVAIRLMEKSIVIRFIVLIVLKFVTDL
jgi:hypothetical protein